MLTSAIGFLLKALILVGLVYALTWLANGLAGLLEALLP